MFEQLQLYAYHKYLILLYVLEKGKVKASCFA